MAFKVMGVTAGRKDSNSEILTKEALLACQEMGAEVLRQSQNAAGSVFSRQAV